MSWNVHYIFASECLASKELLESPVLPERLRSELKTQASPVDSVVTFEGEPERMTFTLEFGVGVLWTNINYTRFLHCRERGRTVEAMDAWVRTWCRSVMRVDELFMDQWFAQLDAAPPGGAASLADLVRLLRTENPEQTHCAILAGV